MQRAVLLILGFLTCTYLSLKQLDTTYFWDDEAYVGIIARNFLATGRFTGWDGRNLLAFRNGTLLDAQLRVINPPLEDLMAASAFWAFGVSTWAGRFPFVIAGLVGLGVFAILLQQAWGKEGWLRAYAFGGLAWSPAFLLNIRQCRYYALALLFALAIYYAYQRCLHTQRWRDFMLLTATALLMFYSNYLLTLAFLLALGVVHVVFHRRAWAVNECGKVALTIGLFSLMTVPYALYYRIWDRPDIPTAEVWYIRKLTLLWWNLREVNLIGYLPWTVVLGLAYILWRYRKQRPDIVRTAWEWLTLGIGYVVFLALLSPQPAQVPTIADVRYLLPALPFLTGLLGVLLWGIHQHMPVVALTLFVASLTTNVLTLTPSNREFRWLLPAYLQEIHQDYPTSYREVIRFLNHNAQPDERIVAYPSYTNYPLMFYASDTLRFCCLLNSRTPLPRQQIEQLHAPLFIEQSRPDWFVSFGNWSATAQLLALFSHPPLGYEGPPQHVSYRPVAVLDVYWRDTHRPELPWHSFGPKVTFDQRTEAVYIFKRVEEGREQQPARDTPTE
jgi:hypothetical protein